MGGYTVTFFQPPLLEYTFPLARFPEQDKIILMVLILVISWLNNLTIPPHFPFLDGFGDNKRLE